MKKSLRRPPRGYSREARQLWDVVIAGWALDEPALAVLDSACRSLMRAVQAQRVVDREGVAIRDRFGQRREHPLVRVERDARAEFRASLRQLNLDLEPLYGKAGRPPGRR